MLYIIAMSTITYNKLEHLCDIILKKHKEMEVETNIVLYYNLRAALSRAARIVLRKAREGYEQYRISYPAIARRFQRIRSIMLDLQDISLSEKERLAESWHWY